MYYKIDLDGVEIKREYDNHVALYEDIGVAGGDHTYSVHAVNKNELLSPESTVEVTV